MMQAGQGWPAPRTQHVLSSSGNSSCCWRCEHQCGGRIPPGRGLALGFLGCPWSPLRERRVCVHGAGAYAGKGGQTAGARVVERPSWPPFAPGLFPAFFHIPLTGHLPNKTRPSLPCGRCPLSLPSSATPLCPLLHTSCVDGGCMCPGWDGILHGQKAH